MAMLLFLNLFEVDGNMMWPKVYMCKDQKHLGGLTDITRKWRVWITQAACKYNSHEVMEGLKMNTHASDSVYPATAFKMKDH